MVKKTKTVKPNINDIKCKLCSKRFSDSSGLAHHIKLHSNERPHSCHLCTYTCKTKKYLSKHVKNVHNAATKHTCTFCERKFHYKSLLQKHMLVHTNEKPHKCDVCGKGFNSAYSLGNHKYIHSDTKPFKCNFCEYACRDSSTLRKHRERHLGITKRYQCKICDKSYAVKSVLKMHISEVHLYEDVKTKPCQYCGKMFKTLSILNGHIKVVHKKVYSCECEICGLVISNKYNMASHLAKHTGMKPFECTFEGCSKKFKDRGSLNKHATTHSPERRRRFGRRARPPAPTPAPAPCHLCGKSFFNENHLRTHIVKKHYDKEKYKYICDICGMLTYNKPSIVMHIKYGHGSEKDLQCKICNKIFKKHAYLKLHYWKTHCIRYNRMIRRPKQKKTRIIIKEEPKVSEEMEMLNEVKVEHLSDSGNTNPTDHFNGFSDGIARVTRESVRAQSHRFDYFYVKRINIPEPVVRANKSMVSELLQINYRTKTNRQITINNERQQESAKKSNDVTQESAKMSNDVTQESAKMSNDVTQESAKKSNDVTQESTKNSNDVTQESTKKLNDVTQETDKNDFVGKNEEINDFIADYENNDRLEDNSENNDKITEYFDKHANENNKKDENNYEDLEVYSESDDELVKNNENNYDEMDNYENNDDPNDGDYIPDEEIGKFDDGMEKIDDKIDKVGDEMTNQSKRIRINTHQCYVCFKLYDTKEILLEHCEEHFDVCNFSMLKKCPLCDFVTKYNLRRHLKLKHNIDINIPYGSRYYCNVNNVKVPKIEVIPSTENLNKQAYIKLDERKRDLSNKGLTKSELVKRNGEWAVEKVRIDPKGFVIPRVDGENYLDEMKLVYRTTKRDGQNMVFPCNKCDKICQTMSALKMHSRRHDPNQRPFKKKVWKHKLSEELENLTRNPNRYEVPKPVVNRHKCDENLIKFYENNIKGDDVEFWQFLKIFNKMSRENINDFNDLENRTDFGIHFSVPEERISKIKKVVKKTIKIKMKNAFKRTIMISKRDYEKRKGVIENLRRKYGEKC